MIIGTWLQSKPICINCSNYVFNEDGTYYISNQPNEIFNFEIIEQDSIKITVDITESKHHFQFSNDTKVLEIENFVVSLVDGEIDIELMKVE